MKSKKIIAVIMAIILVVAIAIPAVLAIPEQPVPMRLVYNESAKEGIGSYDALGHPLPSWRGGASCWESRTLPIGNGILGANVYGETDEDVLSLNEETLWGGGRGSVPNYDGANANGNVSQAYKELANSYVNGTYTSHSTNELAGDSRETSGYDDGYLPWGNMRFLGINHKDGRTDYVRDLNLDDGIAHVSYKHNNVNYSREYFANHDSNVIVVNFKANKNNSISFTTTFEVSGDLSSNFKTSVNGNTGYITCNGEIVKSKGTGHTGNGLKHNAQIAVVSKGANPTVSGNGIAVKNADEVTVYLTAATDYENRFWDDAQKTKYYYRSGETAEQLDARVNGVLKSAANKGYEAIKTEHLNDYHELYNRVSLDLGQQPTSYLTDDLLKDYKNNSLKNNANQRYLEVLLFQYGRYLLISGSREDSKIPTTLQGIWNDRTQTDWNSDLHTNINLQMNYWLSNNCNLTECAKPLIDYMSKLEIPGHITVEHYTGAKHGIMAHTQNTPYGLTGPGWTASWGWSPAAATWLMQNCYDYYQYSQDEATLRKTIYPMLKEQVLMYEELLMDMNGRKVMPITYSPEIGPTTAGNTYEQSLIAQLYKDTIEAANILGLDSTEVAKWQATYDKLDPIQIGTSGQIKEWANETTVNSVENTSGHRHFSNLLGLFPGDIVDTPEEINAAIVSLNNKNFGKVGTDGAEIDGGWTYGQMINLWARVGNSENAHFCVKQLIKQRIFENLWDFHTGAVYQIDGNYGYAAGVAEMLLQSNRGFIDFLPAVPNEWANGSVKGLLAQGNFTVDMEWKNKTLKTAHITAKNAGECKFENPFGDKNFKLVDANGKDVSYTMDKNGICTFNAKAGVEYTVRTVAPLNVRFERNADGHVVLTWDAQPGIEYKIYRKEVTM